MMPMFHPFVMPQSCRSMPGVRMGLEILDLYFADKIVYKPTKPRQIKEPYVCIASQASSACKTWLRPQGYDEIVAYLKSLGYRVICIDKENYHTDLGLVAKIPEGAEDFTGNIPLTERVNQMAYADFFIGASSGLSWLAWAVDIPVVLISGISAPWFEADNSYRVFNKLVCYGCMHDMRIPFELINYCPVLHNTDRKYECSRQISVQQVKNAIDAIRSKLYR